MMDFKFFPAKIKKGKYLMEKVKVHEQKLTVNRTQATTRY